MARCTVCSTGVLLPLGRLGGLLHLRCRDCGAQFSRPAGRPVPDDDEDEEDDEDEPEES